MLMKDAKFTPFLRYQCAEVKMKRIIPVFLLILPLSVYAATPKIIPSKDMTYLGAFKLPRPPAGFSWILSDQGGNGVGGMEYLPTDGTLLILASQKLYRYVTKISIPTPVNSKILGELLTAELLRNPVDIAKGIQQSYTMLGDIHYLPPKELQSTGKLYWSLYGSYTTTCNMYAHCNGQLGWAETDLDNLNSVGMWRFGDCSGTPKCCNIYGKYIFHAPQDWADAYTAGRSLIVGYSRSGGAASEGPVMLACAPWQEGNPPPDARDGLPPNGDGQNEPVSNYYLPHDRLLQYEGPNPTGQTVPHILDGRAVNDKVTSGRWITVGDKRAIVFNGSSCLRKWGDFSWTYPANYYPGVYWGGDNEGYHSDPCEPVLWFYSQDDITAVVQGTKQPYEPQPYRRVGLLPFMLSQRSGYLIAGMAYDEGNGKLYLQEVIDPNTSVIHVFAMSNSGQIFLDSIAPVPPVISMNSVTKHSVTISWPLVTDDSGLPVMYRIYRNGSPIAVQFATAYTDSYLSYQPSPVEYTVAAVDFEGNTAISNTLSIDDSVGGNIPINIYIPAFCLPNTHETSCIKFRIGEHNSVPVYVKGGMPPYNWSLSGFPSELSIDLSTGVISGTPTKACFDYGAGVTVYDAKGNYARRKVAIGCYTAAVSNYYYDRDGDGLYDIGKGGTDTDDLNSENTPGMTYIQPPPQNLSIIYSTSNSVTLSWGPSARRIDPTWWQLNGYNTYRNNQIGLDVCYQVHHGTQPGIYTETIFVGRNTRYTVTGLSPGPHYFSASAIEFRGLESTKSNEVMVTLGNPASELKGFAYGSYYAEGIDQGNSIVETADGNIVMASFTQSYAWRDDPGTEVGRMLLIKINPSTGAEIWRRVVGPEGYDITRKQKSMLHWISTRVIQTGNDLVVTGYNGTTGAAQGVNGRLMRFNASGAIVWEREFNGVSNGDDYLFDIVETAGGGFAAVGHARGPSYDADGWLIITDPGGQNPTHHYYSTNGLTQEYLRVLRKTSDGGYIMAGWTDYGPATEDYYVVKVASDGTIQGAQKYDNSGRRDKATSVEEDMNGNFWIFGRSQLPGHENTKIWMLRLNATGVLQASYTIGDDDNAHAYIPRSTIALSNGNFLIVGYTNVSSGSGYHGYVTEVNISGQVVGSPGIIGAKAGYTEDYLFSGVVSGDGIYYYLAGTDNGAFSTAYDLWFLKLSALDKSIPSLTTCAGKTAYHYDKDLDGYGNNDQWAPSTGNACFAMPGYVLTQSDPDDSNPSVTPLDQGPPALPKGLRIIKP
jgi:hypothetical protein